MSARWRHLFNNVGYTVINALILAVTLAGVANPTHVKCHLWKRFTDVNDQKGMRVSFYCGFRRVGISLPYP